MLSGVALAARESSTRYSFRTCYNNFGKRFDLSYIEFFVWLFPLLGTDRKKSRKERDFETSVTVSINLRGHCSETS